MKTAHLYPVSDGMWHRTNMELHSAKKSNSDKMVHSARMRPSPIKLYGERGPERDSFSSLFNLYSLIGRSLSHFCFFLRKRNNKLYSGSQFSLNFPTDPLGYRIDIPRDLPTQKNPNRWAFTYDVLSAELTKLTKSANFCTEIG